MSGPELAARALSAYARDTRLVMRCAELRARLELRCAVLRARILRPDAKPLIQELSSSSSSPASSAPPPSHSLTLEGEGAQRKFVLSARFEEVEEGAAIDVQVSDKKVILLAPGGSKLELGLAEAVREGEVSAKWKKKKKTLIVDLPIARSF